MANLCPNCLPALGPDSTGFAVHAYDLAYTVLDTSKKVEDRICALWNLTVSATKAHNTCAAFLIEQLADIPGTLKEELGPVNRQVLALPIVFPGCRSELTVLEQLTGRGPANPALPTMPTSTFRSSDTAAVVADLLPVRPPQPTQLSQIPTGAEALTGETFATLMDRVVAEWAAAESAARRTSIDVLTGAAEAAVRSFTGKTALGWCPHRALRDETSLRRLPWLMFDVDEYVTSAGSLIVGDPLLVLKALGVTVWYDPTDPGDSPDTRVAVIGTASAGSCDFVQVAEMIAGVVTDQGPQRAADALRTAVALLT
jgi:hypothetical protein